MHVLILAARNLTLGEATAVGTALAAQDGVRVSYLDARLAVSDAPTPGGDRNVDEASTRPAGLIDRAKAVLLRTSLTRALLLMRGLLADRVRLRRLLAAVAPDAVVIYDDRRARPDLVLRQVAAERGIPVALVPFAVSSVESDILARRGNLVLHLEARPWRHLKRFVAWRWPAHVARDGERDGARSLLFFEPLETCILAMLGILPARPWVLGGSDPDIVCALGEDQRDYLLAGGIVPDRIVVTGQPSLDTVSRTAPTQLAAQLRECYRLPPGVPIVLCAVPQHGEHRMASWERHWQLTEELFAALAVSGAAVLLSLHPKSRRADYVPVAARHGLALLDERLSEVLPAADLLVATFSSTVRWAIGLGIPAVVVDALRTEFRLYHDLPGVTHLADHAALASMLSRFARDLQSRTLLGASAAAGAARVGRLDGGARQRTVRAITQMVALRRARHPGGPILAAERSTVL
jgi:hypothetical protein